jgi:hypothetical protein
MQFGGECRSTHEVSAFWPLLSAGFRKLHLERSSVEPVRPVLTRSRVTPTWAQPLGLYTIYH